jgi:hypothetical protein
VTRRRAAVPSALLLALLLGSALALPACTTTVAGTASAGRAPEVPRTPADLEALLVDTVPSGLRRVPDEALSPPAGEKSAADVAGYAADPARERQVLADYGYRHGWDRFWGSGTGPLTAVFVEQFDTRAGAAAHAADLARNEAVVYDGVLREDPPHLPGGCRLLTVEEPPPGLSGPVVLAWCGSGVFTVAVTAVAATVDAASAEVREVVAAQLARLP